MRPLSHRRAALLACLLTLAASLAHPLLAFGGAVCVSRSHVEVDGGAGGGPLASVEPGCHPSAAADHEPCIDVDLGGSHAAMREATPRADTAPSFAGAATLAALAPPPAAATAGGRTRLVAYALAASTHLDLRVLRI